MELSLRLSVSLSDGGISIEYQCEIDQKAEKSEGNVSHLRGLAMNKAISENGSASGWGKGTFTKVKE